MVCVWLLQVQSLRGNVDMKAAPIYYSYHQNSCEILVTKCTLESNIKLGVNVVLSNIVLQIVLEFCGENVTLGTKQIPN